MISWKAFLAGVGLTTGFTYYIMGDIPLAILMWAASVGMLVVVYYEHMGRFKFRGLK